MKLVKKAEPRFDLDLNYGRQAEARLAEFFDWIAEGKGRVEVKRKRIIDLSIYVEESCDKGRTGRFAPSGISVTTAHVWAFAIADTGIMMVIPTQLLKESLSHPSVKDKAETDGSCPTRGKLVHLRAIFDTYMRSSGQADVTACAQCGRDSCEGHGPVEVVHAKPLNWLTADDIFK